MKTLKDVMPSEFVRDYLDAPAWSHRDVAVVAEHRPPTGLRWPGPQKNVFYWVELATGKAVGWNENPSRGWSFPVINLRH